MTSPVPGRSTQLWVDADLSFEVDGTAARLTSIGGNRLLLESTHPERVWAAVLGAALPAGTGSLGGPRAVGRAADSLAAAGLTMDVTGPHGRIAQLGADVDSSVGRAVTGSAAVAPGTSTAMATLIWRGAPRAVVTAGVVLFAAVAGATYRHFRSRRP